MCSIIVLYSTVLKNIIMRYRVYGKRRKRKGPHLVRLMIISYFGYPHWFHDEQTIVLYVISPRIRLSVSEIILIMFVGICLAFK